MKRNSLLFLLSLSPHPPPPLLSVRGLCVPFLKLPVVVNVFCVCSALFCVCECILLSVKPKSQDCTLQMLMGSLNRTKQIFFKKQQATFVNTFSIIIIIKLLIGLTKQVSVFEFSSLMKYI